MNKLAGLSHGREERYRKYVARMKRLGREPVSRKAFLDRIRRSLRQSQKDFHRKNPLANKYYCWCGGKPERMRVSIEKFAIFHKLAVKDVQGRINPKNKFNKLLIQQMEIA